ncbi:hypothetical protein GKZ68_02170 [Hymenobacter sp. BRD128]|uniref:hypothetical protein n=1 Tax=Hymenobacter sp. BRD128 TaxID=2675878 RepID=UPI0015654097|nr:hypothetical protein [Hymenobacter sp. BRD128]QKG55546.1 hypothetical protein GKZ68_02170 [Hymenobacter sp. BRD128]
MMKLIATCLRCAQLLTTTLLLSGCQLTSSEVEPALPAVPVAGSASLVYRANGLPVVANNSVNIGTIITAFFADPRAVKAKWSGSGSLLLSASDVLNQPDGYLTHTLVLELNSFHGLGTYVLAATTAYPASYYQLTTYDTNGHPLDHAEQYPVASAPSRVVITTWDATTRHLTGTFEASVAGPNTILSPTRLTEGAFDLQVD